MAKTVAEERIQAAIRFEKLDRIAVFPIIDMFAGRYAGVTQHQMLFDPRKADMALEKTILDLGRIDGQSLSYAGFGRILQLAFPSKPKISGVDGFPPDEPWQFVERSVMSPEEYAAIPRTGAARWMLEKLRESHPELRGTLGPLRLLGVALTSLHSIKRSISRMRRKGVESLVGPNLTFTPMEWISLTLRSFNDFILDLYRRPEEVKAASREMMKIFKLVGMSLVRLSGIPRVFLGGTRTSASSLNPRFFEEIAFPEWLEICEYFVERGVTPLLHFDSDWTPFFPYLKELPRRKCILNLDGTSDIFKAKEILGDHFCLMGDVPASLLKLGEPEEVDAYCERLIRELGSDGGFILSSGCTIPVDARPENVRAMINSVYKYKFKI